MALLQNGYRDYSSGVRIFGGTISNNAYPSVHYGTFYSTSLDRNLTAGEGFDSDKVGIPSGYTTQYAWVQPQKAGSIASKNEAEIAFSSSAAITEGRGIAGTAGLTLSASGTAGLIVSGSGDATISLTATGGVKAALNAEGDASLSLSGSADLAANANAVGSATITFSATAPGYAIGHLSGDVVPEVQLQASSFATYLLDEEDVETGLTLRKALRLIAAATAGKVSGASGSTVTIKNAVADTRDRIVATVDANGNRIAISYDLED